MVTTYSEAVKSSNSTKLVDEAQMFKRDSFKTAMQSMQIESVQSAGIAADKQQTFEVTLSVIDVTNKDFWESEKDAIYEQLWKLDKVQGDSQAAQQWLNDYLKTKMQDEKFPRITRAGSFRVILTSLQLFRALTRSLPVRSLWSSTASIRLTARSRSALTRPRHNPLN